MRTVPVALAVVGIVVALSLLALGGFLGEQAAFSKNPTVSGSETVVFIGSRTGFAGETLDSLKSRFSGPIVVVTDLADLSAAAIRVDQSSIVIYNSDWLVSKVGAAALTDFFKTILASQVKIVALGGQTSLLFDALKQAKNDIFAEGRNPARDNPPLAGYKLKQAVRPDGSPYFGASILWGRPETALDAADSIVAWG